MSNVKILVDREHTEKVTVDQYLTILNYFTKDDYGPVSLVRAELNGPHGNRVNRRSIKLYYILDGSLDMVVDGVQYHLDSHDALLVPPGKWHAQEGHNAQMLIICAPAYDFTDEEIEA